MHCSTASLRILFAILAVFFFISFSSEPQLSISSIFNGTAMGLVLAGFLYLLEYVFKGINIRTLNTAALGLFFGYLLGSAILNIFNILVENLPQLFSPHSVAIAKSIIYLFSCYLSVILTVQASNDLHFCIPFFKFIPHEHKVKNILIDPALLNDPRLFNLAKSGLLDHRLILPSSSIDELQTLMNSSNEPIRNKAKLTQEFFKKLEGMPGLHLNLTEKHSSSKENVIDFVQLAKTLGANILTSDPNKLPQNDLEGTKIININLLAQLKPATCPGEQIQITIQRFGKEPRQGIGYLDDGTMVVVNGGGQYIGKTIKATVLSIKPTSSGQIIFCNSQETDPSQVTQEDSRTNLENSHSHYYS